MQTLYQLLSRSASQSSFIHFPYEVLFTVAFFHTLKLAGEFRWRTRSKWRNMRTNAQSGELRADVLKYLPGERLGTGSAAPDSERRGSRETQRPADRRHASSLRHPPGIGRLPASHPLSAKLLSARTGRGSARQRRAWGGGGLGYHSDKDKHPSHIVS